MQNSDSLCKICFEFYGNQIYENMCSSCYNDFRIYHTLSQMTKSIYIETREHPYRIKTGLLIYRFRGYKQSRLRRDYHSTLRVIQTGELKKDIIKPAFRKTLKYVRKFIDISSKSYNEELYNSRSYYLSHQAIRKLKGLDSLKTLLAEKMNPSILQRIFSSAFNLNPARVTIDFEVLLNYANKDVHYLDYVFLLIRKMRKLQYLGLRNSQFIQFGSDFERKFPKYRQIVLNLPRLSEVSLGNFTGKNKHEFVRAFLNYEQLKRIQMKPSLVKEEDTEAYFHGLSNIKELDYLHIDIGYGTESAVHHVIFFDFLRSLKFINTLVINDQYINHSLENNGAYKETITNVNKVIIQGKPYQSTTKLLSVIEGLSSVEIDLRKLNNNLINSVGEALSKHANLKELIIKLDFSHSVLKDFLQNIPSRHLNSFSVYFRKPELRNHTSIEQSGIGPVLLAFLAKQREIQEINIKLFFSIKYNEFRDFVDKLLKFPLLKLLTFYLKIPRNTQIDDDNTTSIRAFLEQLTNLKPQEARVNHKGCLIVRIRNPIGLSENHL